MNKLYIGTRIDIEVLEGGHLKNVDFTILNADDTAYSFSGITDLYLEIFDHAGHGKGLIKKINNNAGISQVDNVITLDDLSYADLNIPQGNEYYYRAVWLNAAGDMTPLFFGALKSVSS